MHSKVAEPSLRNSQGQSRNHGHGHIGQELAKCLKMFSFDVIGIVADYSFELRSLYSVDLDKDLAKRIARLTQELGIIARLIVNSKQQLIVFADKVYVYNAMTMKLLRVFIYPTYMSIASITIDSKTDIIYALVCKHKKESKYTSLNRNRSICKILLPEIERDKGDDGQLEKLNVLNTIEIKDIFPDADCILHHNGQLFVANANVFCIIRDTEIQDIQNGKWGGAAIFEDQLYPTYENPLHSNHVCLAIDPIDSTIYSTENCTEAIRVFRPKSTRSEIWKPKGKTSFCEMLVLSSGHVVGLRSRPFLQIAAVLLQRDGFFINQVMHPPMIIILLKDVAERIYCFSETQMHVLVV